jgi:protoporphyrinogen oxidase
LPGERATMKCRRDDVLVLGAGLSGLSAGHALARAGLEVTIIEKEAAVGGLARTVAHGPFRFDLGGHRFFTQDKGVEALVQGLLGPELSTVPRRSQILVRNRYIDYPLRPLNAMSGLGIPTAWRILLDHARERLAGRRGSSEAVSLEDWVVRHFGRTLFEIYFKDYSEKVWGIGCERISQDWVAQRIQGLSLGTAVRNALFHRPGPAARTLTDRFLYPRDGIGRIAERLGEEIEREKGVRCDVEITGIRHEDSRVKAVVVRDGSRTATLEGKFFVSTLPLPDLVRMLDPRPPAKVLGAAAALRFRDLVIVAVMLDRERATDQSWIYFPERGIPFGRIHEPTNWSDRMAPEGRTLLVAEQFCFRGDEIWRSSDEELADGAIRTLQELGIVSRKEVLDSAVLRIPKAYPLFEVGYQEHRRTLLGYLRTFPNLFPAGRGGTFSYHNMDQAMASGLEAAEGILRASSMRLADRESTAVRARRSA